MILFSKLFQELEEAHEEIKSLKVKNEKLVEDCINFELLF
jgi:hypothetical protein